MAVYTKLDKNNNVFNVPMTSKGKDSSEKNEFSSQPSYQQQKEKYNFG